MRRFAFSKALVIFMSLVLVFSSNSTAITPIIEAYAAESAGVSNAVTYELDETGGQDASGTDVSFDSSDESGDTGTGTGAETDGSQVSGDGAATDLPSGDNNAEQPNSDAATDDATSSDEAAEVDSEQADSNDIMVLADEVVVAASETITYTKQWHDNNEARPATADAAFKLYYKLDGAASWTELTADNMASVGLEGELPGVSVAESGTNVWKLSSSKELPISLKSGNATTTVYWKIDEAQSDDDAVVTIDPNKYSRSIDTTESIITNTKLTDFSVTVKNLVGGDAALYNQSSYTLYRYNEATKEWENIQTIERGDNLTQIDGSNSFTLTVADLPKFDSNNNEFVYSIQSNNTTHTAEEVYNAYDPNGAAGATGLDDWFAPTYENSASANHGTETDRCYQGGTISLTRTNGTIFTINKAWLDGDNIDKTRPNISTGKGSNRTTQFWLWRYTNDGSQSYRSASQVTDSNGYPVGANLPNNGEAYEDGTTNFWYIYANHMEETGDRTYLPKYDAEGYEYVYLAREDLDTSNGAPYTQVYGMVNPTTGVVSDTLPGGYGSAARASDDASIYNGGTITNRLTESKTVTVTKTWNAPAHQGYLSNYVVTMVLQEKPAGADDSAYKNTDTTCTLTGFSPATTSQTANASVPKYNAQGYELEYRWVEQSITYTDADGNPQTATKNSDGSFTTSYNANNTPQDANVSLTNRQNVDWYTSVTTVDEANNSTTTNTLQGYEDYLVRKVWSDENGNLTAAPEGASITVQLYQNGEAYGAPVTLSEDRAATTGMVIHPSDAKWDYYFKDLPKFDVNGEEYIYTAVETSCTTTDGQKYSATYSNSDTDSDVGDAKERCTVISNGPGKGKRIRIEKQWLDDSDIAHREQANVEIGYDVITNGVTEHKTKTVALTAANDWWTIYYFDKEDLDGLDETSISVNEVSLGAEATPHVVQTKDGISTVEACNHVYVVENPGTTYSTHNTGEQNYTITNRRIATVNIAVSKSWIDGNQDEASRPTGAILSLTSDSSELSLSGSTATLTSGAKTLTSAIESGEVDVNDSTKVKALADTTANATQEVKTSNATYYFCNLPKYDLEGKIIHYSVNETWADGATGTTTGDYVISYGSQAYKTGTSVTEADSQTQALANRRSATVDATIYKSWYDTYQFEQGNRPDIKYYIWQKTFDAESGQYKYSLYNGTGFMNYKTQSVSSIQRTTYDYAVSFGSLPKYDANGYEIEYFFEESIPGASKTNFDYNETTYSKGNLADSSSDYGTVADEASDDTSDWLVNYDGRLLLKNAGTFKNSIAKDVTIQGEKIWLNIPSGFAAASLPKITINLSQKLKGAEDATKAVIATTDSSITASDSSNGFTKVSSTNWKFTFIKSDATASAQAAALPKYDENGNLYEYSVAETIDGSDGEEGLDWNTVYNKEEAGFSISNVYNPRNGEAKLAVSKNWTYRPEAYAKNKYPLVTFEVYQLQTTDGSTYAPVSSSAFATKTLDMNTSTTNTVEFELPVYAPNGQKYKYYVVEKGINGQTQTINATEGISAATAITLKANDTTTLSGPDGTTTVTNSYTPETLTIEGTKKWNDGSNAAGLRPDELSLKLYRYANAQSGVNNAIEKQEVEDKATWSQSGDTWTFTYSNLEKWAPNGTAWIYEVEETEITDGYAVSYSSKALHGSTSSDKATVSITNSYTQGVQFVKTWANDSNNKYGTRPAALSIKLQAAVVESAGTAPAADSADWKDVTDTSTFGTSLSSYLCKQVSGSDSSAQITTGSFPYTLNNLPYKAFISDEQKYLAYRIVEVSETAADGKVNPKGKATSESEEATLKNYTSTTGDTTYSNNTFSTTSTNTLETVGLTITKTWSDHNNFWGQRAALNFVLQYQTTNDEGEITWANYAPSISFALEPSCAIDANTWSRTIQGLPKCDTDGKAYVWRVLETGYRRYSPSAAGAGTSTQDGNGNYTSAVTNTLNTSAFAVEKLGQGSGSALNGAVFDVYKSGEESDASKRLFTWTSDSNGGSLTNVAKDSAGAEVVAMADGKISGLPIGIYTFIEQYQEGINAAYKQQLKFTVSIAADGTIEKVAQTSDSATGTVAYSADDVKITATDALAKAKVKVNKYLNNKGTQQTLSDVTFELYKKDGEAWAKQGEALTTDSNGQVTLADLGVGQYYLKETKVPSNTVLSNAEYHFAVVNTNGGLVVQDGELATGMTIDSNKASISIVNDLFGAHISFEKRDATTNTKIAGAEFKLYRKGDDGAFVEYATLTSSDGSFNAGGLEKGDYELVETVTPQGYTTTPKTDESGNPLYEGGKPVVMTFGVEVGENDKVVDIYWNGQQAAGTTNWVNNERVLGSAVITKTDDAGEGAKPLAGTQFKIEYKELNADDSAYVVYATDGHSDGIYTTGSDGKISLSNLPWGVYRVTEVAATEGYLIGANGAAVPQVFTVDSTTVVDSNNQAKATTAELAFTNAATQLTVTKVDDSGKGLSGAELVVSDSSGKEFAAWTSDGSSYVLTNLKVGETYTISEQRHAGYYALSGEVAFKIGADGKATLVSDGDGAAKLDDNKLALTLTNTLIKKDLEFTKTELINEASADKSLDGLDPHETKPLEGAEFTLHATKLEDTGASFSDQTVRSDASGKVSFTGLLEGTYTVSETLVPEGHTKAADYVVQVTSEGKVLMGASADSLAEVTQDNPVVIVNDRSDRQTFSFTKVSDVDGTVLPGATYTLYRLGAANSDGVATQDDSQPIAVATAMSGQDGKVNFEGLLPEYKYRVVETIAPAGSLLSADPIEFQFVKGEDSSYSVQLLNQGEADVDGTPYYTITVDADGNLVWEEPQTEYNFIKLDESGNQLVGAALQVVDSSNNIIAEWTTDGAAYSVIGKLVAGKTYTLHEVSAPSGYALADDVQFTVVSDAAEPGRQHTQAITMVDALLPKDADNKKSDGGGRLSQTGDTLPGNVFIGLIAAAGIGLVAASRALDRKRN